MSFIEELKNADSKKIIVYVFFFLILILLIIFGFDNDKEEKEADINNMEIETTEASIYDSKLAAYKDKSKEDYSPSYNYDVDMKDYISNKDDETYQEEDEDIKRLQASLKQEAGNPQIKTHPRQEYNNYYSSQPEPKIITNLKETVKEQPKEAENKENESPTPPSEAEKIEKPEKTKTSRFFRAEKQRDTGNVISALIHGEQVVSDGSTVLFRITEDLYTDENILIPKNTYVSGKVKLTSQRMIIELESVKVGKNIYPIKKKVFDTDGLFGLEIDNDTKAKIAKQASASAIENTNTNNNNSGNVLSNAASAVGDAAKSVLAKEQREIKVTLKNNRKILLQ